MKRIALVGAFALAILAAGSVAAHSPSASLSCHDGTPLLTIDLTNYNPAVTNTVSYGIDGAAGTTPEVFLASFHRTVSVGSPFVTHHVQVVVKAGDDPDGTHGWTIVYNLTGEPCQTPSETFTCGLPCESPTPTPSPTLKTSPVDSPPDRKSVV